MLDESGSIDEEFELQKAAAIGLIGVRTVQQQIAVDRNLAGPQHIIDHIPVTFGVIDCLIQHVTRTVVAAAEGNLSVAVRSADELHAGVFSVGIVNRQPDRHRAGRRQRPVAGVLMPVDASPVAGQLAEKMGSPADDVRSQ